jgi:hypothetical protein
MIIAYPVIFKSIVFSDERISFCRRPATGAGPAPAAPIAGQGTWATGRDSGGWIGIGGGKDHLGRLARDLAGF